MPPPGKRSRFVLLTRKRGIEDVYDLCPPHFALLFGLYDSADWRTLVSHSPRISSQGSVIFSLELLVQSYSQ